MFSYTWPIILVVLSNIVYQIFAKEVTPKINVFASLTITYFVACLFSGILFFLTNKNGNIISEIAKTNWAPIALGISIIGLEAGFIFAYKAGWQVSTASIVQSSLLAVALLVVGFLVYKEALSWNKLVGVAVCLTGLIFINLK
ncbi:MAG: EamA family transporter [Clostridia bacterium]|nr:EamA family transporter [Clostridia bacterium]